VSRVISLHSAALAVAAFCCATLLTGCVTAEPRPAGVPRGILFSATPVYPRSFDIVALGSRRMSAEVLKDAWHKKAAMVAEGRRYKASSLTVHDTEAIPSGGYGVVLPQQARRVSGTISLSD
jgi:hypothetical protein